jgi:DNA-binding NtrC family response regulator
MAGAAREAFRDDGFDARLVVSADDLEGQDDANLLILSGKLGDTSAVEMARAARDDLHIPVFGIFSHADTGIRDRAAVLGLEEYFTTPPDLDHMVLLGRRVAARRGLQQITGILGESDAIRQALERILQIAQVDSTVLITGESGTGKELVARGIHDLSRRRHSAFIAVNVAALPETLLESELFGHAKGAFTGAIDSRKGLFELAHGGTIFLDEMGEMPLATQTKLLRVLETREFLRVGGETPVHVDLRVIAATNQDLRQRVAIGEFRRDLYHRLNVLHIELPPLRDRREDIPILVDHFIREVSETHDRDFPGLSAEAEEILESYDWPGNVRELRNLVESMVVLAPGREVRAEDIPDEVRNPRSHGALSPVPVRADLPARSGEGGQVGRAELEFIFRTLVEMRMDMDQLRREFERYQQERRRSGDVAEISRVTPGAPDAELPAEVVDVAHAEIVSSGRPDEEAPDAAPTAASSLALPDGAILFRPGMTMEELERDAIAAALAQTRGNRRKAAEMLGIGERTLYRKISKYGLDSQREDEA